MLHELSERLKKHEARIEAWFSQKSVETSGEPLYASVDLRNSGYKIAPVDTNIFPAGFNNLCPSSRAKASKLLAAHIEKYLPGTKKILIYPEDHTRNLFYLESLSVISEIVSAAGFEARIGSFNPALDDFDPDAIIINNDFSGGVPDIFKSIKKPLLPSPFCGWHTRRKSDHFRHYSALAEEFAALVGIDPWFLRAEFSRVGELDFFDPSSLERIAQATSEILEKTAGKMKQHGIKDRPYVVVKNDAGTYGMAVMAVHSADEIIKMNRRQKMSMSVGKGKRKVTEVIVQEGVATADRFENHVAEPVIYLIGNEPSGGFFRLHEEKNERENLNSPGMKFTKLCFHEMTGYSNIKDSDCPIDCVDLVYKTIAKIASVAAGFESLAVGERV